MQILNYIIGLNNGKKMNIIRLFLSTFLIIHPLISHGLTITIFDISSATSGKGIRSQLLQNYQNGVKLLENTLADNVTVHVGVAIVSFKEKNLPSQYQAGFWAHKLPIKQNAVVTFLSQDAKSTTDKKAVTSLQKYLQSVNFLSLGYSKIDLASEKKVPVLDQNQPFFVNNFNNPNNTTRLVTTANLKAIDPHFSYESYGGPNKSFEINQNGKKIILDGFILINSDYPIIYNEKNKDILNYNSSAVFNHELLGILGLQDTSITTLREGSLPGCDKQVKFNTCITKSTYEKTPLGSITDLFRYSKKSTKLNIVDWTIQSEIDEQSLPYFSIDEGKTPVMYFSFGGEDSREQPGLWASPSTLQRLHERGYNFALDLNQKQFGLNGPIINTSFEGNLSQADLIALDAIGWDLK